MKAPRRDYYFSETVIFQGHQWKKLSRYHCHRRQEKNRCPGCCCLGGFAIEKCRGLERGHQQAKSHHSHCDCSRADLSSQVWLLPFRKPWVCLVVSANSSWVKENILKYQTTPICRPCGDFLCAPFIVLTSHTMLGLGLHCDSYKCK